FAIVAPCRPRKYSPVTVTTLFLYFSECCTTSHTLIAAASANAFASKRNPMASLRQAHNVVSLDIGLILWLRKGILSPETLFPYQVVVFPCLNRVRLTEERRVVQELITFIVNVAWPNSCRSITASSSVCNHHTVFQYVPLGPGVSIDGQ